MTSLRVVFEDDRLLAVDKPAGRLVVPGRGPAEGPCLREEAEAAVGRRLWVVHRLDRDTSGLLVFAKDERTHRALSLRFESRQVRKLYRAAVAGRPPDAGEVDRPLRRFGSGRMGVDPRGKPSVTRYRVLERAPDAALLEIEPLTGRQHQIRAHLWSLGHPVLGDPVYTRAEPSEPPGGTGAEPPRMMLHARALSFRGPDGGLVDLVCEPPDEFTAAWRRRRDGGPAAG